MLFLRHSSGLFIACYVNISFQYSRKLTNLFSAQDFVYIVMYFFIICRDITELTEVKLWICRLIFISFFSHLHYTEQTLWKIKENPVSFVDNVQWNLYK